jgi:hypothetical protein
VDRPAFKKINRVESEDERAKVVGSELMEAGERAVMDVTLFKRREPN